MKPSTSRLVSYGLTLMSISALLFGHFHRYWGRASVATAGAATLGASSISLLKYIIGLKKTPITEMQDQANALLEDLASRSAQEPGLPIIFVGHSFGGLVIKQAIVQAASDDRYRAILGRIKGVIFLGTPHKGSQLATASQRWFFPFNDIRAVLAVDSKDLMSLDLAFRESDFFNTSRGVFCFYEKRPSSYGPRFLGLHFIAVKEESARLPDRPAIEMDTTHSKLVKFESRSDPNYLKLLHVLRSIIDLQ